MVFIQRVALVAARASMADIAVRRKQRRDGLPVFRMFPQKMRFPVFGQAADIGAIAGQGSGFGRIPGRGTARLPRQAFGIYGAKIGRGVQVLAGDVGDDHLFAEAHLFVATDAAPPAQGFAFRRFPFPVPLFPFSGHAYTPRSRPGQTILWSWRLSLAPSPSSSIQATRADGSNLPWTGENSVSTVFAG